MCFFVYKYLNLGALLPREEESLCGGQSRAIIRVLLCLPCVERRYRFTTSPGKSFQAVVGNVSANVTRFGTLVPRTRILLFSVLLLLLLLLRVHS